MIWRLRNRTSLLIAFLILPGCLHPVRQEVDEVVCALAAHPLDVQISAPSPKVSADQQSVPSQGTAEKTPAGSVVEQAKSIEYREFEPRKQGEIQQVNYQAAAQPRQKLEKRLQMPKELPGGDPQLRLPDGTTTPEQRQAAIKALFPPLPALPASPRPQPSPNGKPFTLSELQQIAMANSPLIRQAAADVQAAQGALKQAGAYPNPSVGYKADTAGTGGTAGYQGVFIEQMIKTAGKLKTAQASAMMSLANAELALRKAQTDVMAQVRSGYFGVLVASYSLEVNQGMTKHTDAIYEVFRDYAIGGLRPSYEAIELRALSIQMRNAVIQSQNRYVSAWNQLAATLGKPDLPLSQLEGSSELPVPIFDREATLAKILETHTDVLTSRNGLQKARYDLHLAEITPIPDVDLQVAVQKDFTTPPFGIVHSVQLGVPIPVWDRNRGNIRQAQAALLRATEEEHRVRTDLSTRFADAFERYDNNQKLAEHYRTKVIPDLKKVYNLVLLLFNAQTEKKESDLNFLDIINNQQLYVNAVTSYIGILSAQWTAVSDVANLAQTENVFAGCSKPEEVPTGSSTLPCTHPCDPLIP